MARTREAMKMLDVAALEKIGGRLIDLEETVVHLAKDVKRIGALAAVMHREWRVSKGLSPDLPPDP